MGRNTKLTVKRPPSYTSDSNHLHNHANRARKSWRSDVPGGHDPRMLLIVQLLRDNLTTSTSDQEPAKTDEPAAEPPVETAEDEIADKAEEPNTHEIKVKESAALDLTKRRLELRSQSTSRSKKQSAYDCCRACR